MTMSFIFDEPFDQPRALVGAQSGQPLLQGIEPACERAFTSLTFRAGRGFAARPLTFFGAS
jgi:hypothetical protein